MTYFPPYAWPCAVHSISDSFAVHVARRSVNPGTDYKAAWGSPVYSVWDGYVSGVVTTNYGSGGRMIFVDHDDQTGSDYLHLSKIAPGIVAGKRVFRGQLIGYSGASGFGEEFYYGAHLHLSIRNTHGWHSENHGNFDFDAAIRNQIAVNAAAAGGSSTPIVTKGWLDMLTDAEQAELLNGVRDIVAALQPGGAIAAIKDGIFKTSPIEGATTGGNSMPGGLLRMASINYDATVQTVEAGAGRDGTLPALQKIKAKLGITP